jgi:HAD superfamily hydrolase (TIGR01549 family)
LTAISFDFGQTLAELDHSFLQTRLAERAADYEPAAAERYSIDAWARYGELKDAGHAAAWQGMMQVFLRAGGVSQARLHELGQWLWHEQPRKNLWRRPIPGMIELVRELRSQGVRVGILSNSEGHLAELVAELGWSRDFDSIADSGKLGIDKPQPGIFRHVCAELGVPCSALVHVGDSWQADVEGARGVAAKAVWFDARHRERTLPAGVYGAASAAELREVVARLGLVS